MSTADFTTVTEVPGVNVTRREMSHIYTRYQWASVDLQDKDVLEVACGSGQGLGYFIAHGARHVTGTDIERANLAHAQNHYKDIAAISLDVIDAMDMSYEDCRFDVVVNFEAIYYMKEIKKAFSEAYRVLRPGGYFYLSTVNPLWHGFNRSPYSIQYPDARELSDLLSEVGFDVKVKAGFVDKPGSTLGKLVKGIRTLAVKLRLIPNTMKGKELLKRIFYGKLESMPNELKDGVYESENLVDVALDESNSNYIFLYAKAVKPE